MQWRRVPWPIIAGIAVALTLAAMSTGQLGQRIEYDVSDLGSRLLRREIASDVVIVGIDSRSLGELDEWPWPRRYHADLISRIAEAVPRRLFLDIDFSARSNPEDDARLAEAFRRWRGPPIVLPAFFQHATAAGGEQSLTRPMPALRPHSAIASVNLVPSADGLARSMRIAWQVGKSVLPSVPVLLDGAAAPEQGELLLDWSIDPASFE